MTILNLFEDNVKKYPNNTAVIYENRRYTYSEIDVITTRLACRIMEYGEGEGLTASILIPRCEYMPIVPLALMKAGMTYVPLDYTYPAERLSFIIDDSDSDLLIGTKEEMAMVGNDVKRLILPSLEDCKDILAWKEDNNLELTEVEEEDVFSILYTSGTTGNPKGTIIPHRSPMILSDFMRRKFRMTPEDIYGTYSSYGFDACNMDIFLPLTCGAALCIIPQEAKMEMAKLYEYVNRNKVSMMFLPTAIGTQYFSQYDSGSLRCILTGGEKLMPWGKTYDDCEIYNIYGPTECFVFNCCYLVRGDEEEIPVGKANNGNRIYILTENGEEVAKGETGEVCIAGRQVSLGYLNNTELTKQVFTKNPFADDDYGTLYHTGDLGYCREDGNIMIVGRKDSQVKINGNRLELKEVEMVIRHYPGIRDVAVDAKKLSNGRKVLVAYVVSDVEIDSKDLCRYISERKPSYMVPSAVMQLEQIPLNQNGKIDHRSLPMPNIELTDNYVAPRNKMEEKLCNIFSQVMGIQGIGIDHDIIELGGDSLSIMNILDICCEFPGLNAALVIEKGTARKIVETLNEVSHNIAIEEERTDYPLYGFQKDLYEFYVNAPGNKLLQVEQGVRMSLEVDEERLRQAVITTINNYPALKVRFRRNANGEPRVIRNDTEEVVVDICYAKESDIPSITDEMVRYFNLAEEPCYRIKIVVTEQYKYLIINIHHFVTDGVSMGILFENINNAYMGKPLTKEVWTAFDMALHAEKMVGTKSYEAARKWYEETFENLTCDILPEGDLEQNGDPVSRMVFVYPLGITKAELEKKSKELNTTATILADTAFAYNIGRYINRQEAVFVTVSEGRYQIENQKTIGCFALCEPVYCKWNKETELAQMLEEMKSMRYSCMVHSSYPASNLRKFSSLSNKIIFVNQIYLQELKEFCGHEASELRLNVEELYYGIGMLLCLDETTNMLYVSMMYRESRYSEAFIRQYAMSFEEILKSMMNNRMP